MKRTLPYTYTYITLTYIVFLIKGINSPKFYSEISKHETPSIVHHTCGPGSEISFAPLISNSILSVQNSQKEFPMNINNDNSPNNNTNTNNNGIRPHSLISSPSSSFKKIILSGDLFDKHILEIGPNGYEQGLRKKKDGHFYLGFVDYKDSNGNIANDYVLPSTSQMLNNNNNNEHTHNNCKRLFEIVYDKNDNIYLLNFLHRQLTMNCLIIEYDYYLDYFKNINILIGDVTLVFYAKKNNDKHSIEVIVNDKNNKVSNYSFLEYAMPVTLGRKNCTITLKHENVSKVHAFIFFSKEKGKFFIKDNFSTNKTYLILKEGDTLAINHSYDAKIGDKQLKIEYINN